MRQTTLALVLAAFATLSIPVFAQTGGGSGGNVPSCTSGQFVKGPGICATPSGSGNVTGPGSSTNGYVPTWSGTSGTSLATGLPPVTTAAAASLVETNGSGTIDPSFLPNPTSSTLGGVRSFATVSSQWIKSISTAGIPAASQPACGDLSNSGTGCSTTVGTLATQNANALNVTGVTALTGLPMPVSASDAVTKSYVDALSNNTFYHSPVTLATAAVLPNTPTYNNGAGTLTSATNAALVVDGVTESTPGDRVLVDMEASALTNGIYTLTQAGTGSVPWILTRATDFNTVAAGNVALGASVLVTGGSTQAGFNFWMSTSGTITLGVTAITWVQSAQTAIYAAANGVCLSGSTFSLCSIAANSVLANTTGGSSPPSTALAYGTTGNNTLLETGAAGTIAASTLPFPSATTLGGIESFPPVAHNWIRAISVLGVPASSQPDFSDLTGQATLAQLPTIGNSTVLGNVSGGSATPIALSTVQLTTLCNAFTSSLSGCVVASGGGTGNFLRADGAWATPTGSGTVNSGSAPSLAQYVGSVSTTVGPATISGDATVATGGALTLATVNGSPGATTCSSVTTNGKGLVTANSTGACGATITAGPGLGNSQITFNGTSTAQTVTNGSTLYPQMSQVAKTASYTINADCSATVLCDTARVLLANGSGSIAFTVPNPVGTLAPYQFADESNHGFTIPTVGGSATFIGCVAGSPTTLTVPAGYAAQVLDQGSGANTYYCIMQPIGLTDAATRVFTGNVTPPGPVSVVATGNLDPTVTAMCGGTVHYNSSSAGTLSILSTWPANCNVSLEALGTGLATIASGSGTAHGPSTCTALRTKAQYSIIFLHGESTGVVDVDGDCG